RPMPVTTTRFMLVCRVRWDRALALPRSPAAASLVRFDEGHSVLDGVELLGPEIVDEAGILGHLGLVDAKMLHDDLFYSVGDIAHRLIPRRINALVGWTFDAPAEGCSDQSLPGPEPAKGAGHITQIMAVCQ